MIILFVIQWTDNYNYNCFYMQYPRRNYKPTDLLKYNIAIVVLYILHFESILLK